MNLLRWAGVISVTVACGCASAPPETTTATTAHLRHRPRHSSVNRVLTASAQRAAGCIPPTVSSVTVSGAFDGPTGEFRVENVESPQPIGSSVRTCIRQEFETARVDPFSEASFPSSRTFGPETEEPDAGAAADASVIASASPSGPDAGAASSAAPVASAAPTTPTPTGAESNTASAAPATNPSPPQHDVAPLGHVRQVGPVRAVAAEAGPVPRATVLGCYRAVSRQDPTLGGQIRLRFTVTLDGAPQNVRVDNVGAPTGRAPLFAEAMHCVESRVRHMNFDRTASGDLDLLISLTPSRTGGDVSIERASLGLLATAPGTGPLETAPTPTPTEPGTIRVNGETNASSSNESHSAASAEEMRQVAAVLRGRVADVRGCYQQGLSRDAALQMRLRVRFGLTPSGAASGVSSTAVATSGDADAATSVAECIEALVRGMTFASRAGANTVDVTIPFSFAPSAGAASTNGAPTVAAPSGRIDPTRTSEAIRNQTASIRECYARALATDSALAGRVMVRFTVDTSGRVLTPSSQTTTRGGNPTHLDDVAHCIENVLGAMTLPAPTGGPAAVALPFDFGPSS